MKEPIKPVYTEEKFKILNTPPEFLSQKCNMRIISVDTMLESGMRFIKMAEAQRAMAEANGYAMEKRL